MNSTRPPYVAFTGVHHLALITADLQGTIRFYRDLLGMRLGLGMGSGTTKHYVFQLTERDALAFFEWEGASPAPAKRPGVPTTAPRSFDHVAFGVGSRDDLFTLRDRLAEAGVTVEGPVDHGFSWSIYFKDPNGIDLEVAWSSVELLQPFIADLTAPPAAREGSEPRPGTWPSSSGAAPRSRTVKPGVGHELGDHAVRAGIARYVESPQPEDVGSAA
jgi:catechol 2,3-dioxygenase-like lactoylglutathione lyase family enzyme